MSYKGGVFVGMCGNVCVHTHACMCVCVGIPNREEAMVWKGLLPKSIWETIKTLEFMKNVDLISS